MYLHVFLDIRIEDKGSYIYNVHMEGGRGFLKFFRCFWILYFLDNRFIVHFCGWRGCDGGGSQNCLFFVNVIKVINVWFLIMEIVQGNIFFFNVTINIYYMHHVRYLLKNSNDRRRSGCDNFALKLV